MRSRRDVNQISQYEHDEESNSKKVKITDTELSIELNADDGDSVQAQSRCASFGVSDNEEIDISAYSRVKIYVESNGENTFPISLEISPESTGNTWMSEGTTITPEVIEGQICASNEVSIMGMRVRIPNTQGHKVILILKGI